MSKLGPRAAAVAVRITFETHRRGLNGAKVAAGLGITKQAFSRRHRGITPWTIDELDALSNLLEVPIADLLDAPPQQRSHQVGQHR